MTCKRFTNVSSTAVVLLALSGTAHAGENVPPLHSEVRTHSAFMENCSEY
jgi:hypothetical protein